MVLKNFADLALLKYFTEKVEFLTNGALVILKPSCCVQFTEVYLIFRHLKKLWKSSWGVGCQYLHPGYQDEKGWGGGQKS